MTGFLNKHIQGFRSAPLTGRERAGVAVLAAIAASAVAFQAFELRERQIANLKHSPLADIVGSLSAEQIATLASAASQARTRAVTAATPQIALIEAHTLITEYAQRAGLQSVQVKVSRGDQSAGLRLSFLADYNADGFHAFLRTLASSEKSISIDGVQVSNTQPAKLKMELRLAYLKERRP